MKPLNKKRAVTLYETRMSCGYIVATVVCYVIAAILWYAVAAVAPYTAVKTVGASDNARVTRDALSATAEQIAADEQTKERALLMPSSELSFCRRLRAVADAQCSIDYMIYDSYEQDYSYYFYAALLDAADRGVKVRIIVDGKLGRLSGTLDTLGKLLQNHNSVEFYYFNAVNLLDPAGLFVLLHDKVMLVDGQIAIVGGVNMGTGAFLGNYDMEVMISNSGVQGCGGAIARYFNALAEDPLTTRIVSDFVDLAAKTRYIDAYKEFYGQSEFATADIDYKTQGVAVDKVTFLTNEINDGKKSPIILQAVYNLTENSQKTTVVTPYTLLENDKKRKLKRLAASCGDFTLITNSLYNTRNVAFADYYYTRKAYIDDNIRLLEFQADDQLHAKMFTFDGRYSMIGSFNLDERSAHIDTESVVIIDSPAFTATVDRYIEQTFINNSLQVGKNNEYLPSETVLAHDVPMSKRILYGLYRALGIVRCLI